MGISKGSVLIPLLGLLLSACATTPRAPAPGAALSTLSGEPVELAALASSREATVLVFWASDCPCVRRYEARMEAIAARHPAVQVLAVASNAGDGREHVRRVAKERGLLLPLLMDEGGALARTLAVRSTPTVVVLDRAGRLVFRGWIDNEREPGESGRVAYLDDALDAMLSGRPFASRSPVYGCPITRSLLDPVPECCRAASSGVSDAP